MVVRARFAIAGFALMLAAGLAPAASAQTQSAQTQSRDMPATVSPYTGNYSTPLADGEARSLSRGGFGDTFGQGDSAAGAGRPSSTAEFGFGSSTPLLHGSGPTVAPSAGGQR